MRRLVPLLAALFFAASALAFEPFTVKDIRVEGLRRISAGTVFNYLPLQVGETLDPRLARQAIRALYNTGFFRDVSLTRDGDVLVIAVVERPSIDDVEITGNKSLESKQLEEGLARIGLARGRVYNRSLLEKVEQELQSQYFSLGKYGVKIETTVTPLERNRVAIAIQITEGQVARIRQINIVGNNSFPEKKLLKQFQLSTPNWLSFYTKNDQYSKQKLAADLEALRSFYLDRGYVNFSIDSTQVSITPDKQDVYITVGITEGAQYTLSDVRLEGELVVPKAELEALMEVKPGEMFSRRAVTDSAAKLGERLAKEGYAFANINAIPQLDNERKQVALTFFVDPGRRVYVRRINVAGNAKTADEVLRREMRQMEGAVLSTEKLDLSRQRLDRLGYFEEVNVETPPVPGTTDQVDVNYSVVERPSGNLLAGLGFSQSQGIIFNASISQENFLGTGKRVGLAFNTSQINTVYSFSYNNPYYTIDGVSRGFNLYYRKTDTNDANIGRYDTDVAGGNVNYGIPISEFDRIRFGLGPERLKVKSNSDTPPEYVAFLDDNGDNYTSLLLTGGWTRDTRDKAIFPTKGLIHDLSLEVGSPLGGLQYYKADLASNWYRPLGKLFTLSLGGDVGYGNGYGDTPDLPFFENFFAGGPRSVRGFEDNTLGPRSVNNEPLGGSFKVVGNAEILFPPPFLTDTKSVRIGLFFDAGTVYAGTGDVNTGDLRYSVGISTQWLSPLGPLVFSFAQALNADSNDNTQPFQFSIGTAF